MFKSFDLACDGDRRVLGVDGKETQTFVDPLRVQYRDVVEASACQ